MHTRYRSCAWGPAATLTAPPPAAPAPLGACTSNARPSPIRRQNTPRRVAEGPARWQTARGRVGAGQTVKTSGGEAQGGPRGALTGSFAAARKHTCSERRAGAQCARAWRPRAARKRPGPNPWHKWRMPCSSAAAPELLAGLKAAQSANGRHGIDYVGGRAARTHLVVAGTRLLMAGTFTSMPMDNAAAKRPADSAEYSPAEQQQEVCEQERRRERPKWECDATRAHVAALRSSNLIHTMEKGRTSFKRREIGAQARLRAWCCGRPRCCCTLAARHSTKESTAKIAATNPGWADGSEGARPHEARCSSAV